MTPKIYTPPKKAGLFAKELRGVIYDAPRAMQMAAQIFVRETSAQYRQSFLGVIWGVITPIFSALVWILLQSSGAIRVFDTGMPYPFFVASGTLLWASFSESVFGPIQSLRQSKQILNKVNFPKEALIVSGFYRVLLNSLLRIFIILILALYFGVFSFSHILWVPFYVFVLIVSGLFLGVLIAPIGMLIHDVSRAMPLLLQALMYASPVIYAMPKSGILALVFKLNPLSPVLINARNSFGDFGSLEFEATLFLFLSVLFLFSLALVFFRKSMGIIIEKGN